MRTSQLATLLLAPGVLGAPRSTFDTETTPAHRGHHSRAASLNPRDDSVRIQTEPVYFDGSRLPAAPGNSTPVKNQTESAQTGGGKWGPGFHIPDTYRNVLYFTNWGIYGANFQPQELPVDRVTHVLFAFANIVEGAGTVVSSDTYSDYEKHYPTDSWADTEVNAYGCVKQLFLHKQKNRHLKVLLSIGGWTWSHKFAPVARTEAGRQEFASSAVKLMGDYGFDGLDIDWEYPKNAQEADDFVQLLKACRAELDRYARETAPGYHFALTVASPAGAQHYDVMDLEGMDPLLDAWHLMAYDYAGSWDTTSGHQAAMFRDKENPITTKFNTEEAIDAYLDRGIPSDKIVMGLPLYGRSFMNTDGIGQSFNGVGKGSIEPGVWLYRDLPQPGSTETAVDSIYASYSYNPSTRELVSYDTVSTTSRKGEWIRENELGGALFWEASGDQKGPKSLVGAMSSTMYILDGTPNNLAYPKSRFANIRNGSGSNTTA
ncbi:related to endochitinase [Cephalotrichum gorgonifer]|uniref:chitinase n=1 Tax=Cephalotrichum gorgonifer TaxID=2041049 RepID=A0AAE8MQZ9_9PEZI|nr:related to endochitinase [Cephalotrichum gorgonifer]